MKKKSRRTAILRSSTCCSPPGWKCTLSTFSRWAQGKDLTYEVRGDSVIERNPKAGPDGMLVLTREKDGSLSAGMLGSLRKK